MKRLTITDRPRARCAGMDDDHGTDPWAAALALLSAERRTALVHGAVGAEPAAELAARLGTTEHAARELAASSLLAFRQAVLRALPVGTDHGCALVAEHRTDDVLLDAARRRSLEAHAVACTTCAPTVAEVLALQDALRPRVAALVLGAEADTWLAAAPRRSWVPGVDRPADPRVRRRRTVLGAGLAAVAVTAVALLGGSGPEAAPRDVAAVQVPVVDAGTDGDAAVDGRNQVVLAGTRIAARTPVVDAGPAGPRPPGGGAAPQVDTAVVGFVDEDGGLPGGPGTPGGPDAPEEDPDTPPLDVRVDAETGSITVTVGLLGDPITITTPPITRQPREVNKR